MSHTLSIDQAASAQAAKPLLSLAGVGKTYGNTRAALGIDFAVGAGEVIGLVGANGAGKSTLMRIVCGVTEPSEGAMAMDGAPLDASAYSPRSARDAGIRIVWQELSLSPNLTVAENFYVEQPQLARLSPLWLRDYHRLAAEGIERIFPGAKIPTGRLVADLSIAERQIVEIARAASDPDLRLLVLDEPTSSLAAERSAQLRRFVHHLSGRGVAVIFISHKLAEVLDVATRVVAMRNGRIVWQTQSRDATVTDLIGAMSGNEIGERAARSAATASLAAPVRARIGGALTAHLDRALELRAGEIVGIAGLEGSGQRDLLQRLFTPRAGGDVSRDSEKVRYVSGDRQREGVFPLWSVLDNISIGRIARLNPFARVNDAEVRPLAKSLAAKLALDDARFDAGILDLSGGNQQKVLVARALVDEVEIILLDDPTRGVDIAAKRDFYRLVREIADAGCLVVWHSTEDLEFLECDRVLVFSRGEVIAELHGAEISEDKVVAASFTQPQRAATLPAARAKSVGIALVRAVPFVSLVLVFATMAWMNPLVASSFGIELLLAPAVTLVLIALAQMFVVGGSEIDLGVGSFAGMVNVVSATLLVTSPLLGVAGLIGGFIGYALVAVLIQARAIPAIVVTLGTSFIWMGIGRTIQPSPGGSSPEWLREIFTWTVPGVPAPLTLIVVAGIAAYAIDRSRAGTLLRAFGSSPLALSRAGWSPLRYGILRYAIACGFATVAGLYVTASNGASDINAGASFTLLSIAAVVIGGCQLLGGIIAPLGVVAGAVTLSLIGALLASLGVSTDYNAAVQGALLIVILGLQALALTRGRRHG
jgi:ribose transport system ATP-binding protein